MVVHGYMVADPVPEALDGYAGGMGECLIAALQVREPELPWPEACRPFNIVYCLVYAINGIGVLAFICIEREVPPYYRDRVIYRGEPLLLFQFTDHVILLDTAMPDHAARHLLLVSYQPFRPLEAIPSTKKRWNARNTIRTGRIAMTLVAMINPYSAEYCPMNILIPSCIVFVLSLLK